MTMLIANKRKTSDLGSPVSAQISFHISIRQRPLLLSRGPNNMQSVQQPTKYLYQWTI